MRGPIKIGTTGYRDEVYIVYASGNAAGQPYTGLLYNTAGLSGQYYRNTSTGIVNFTLNTASLGTYTSGGFIEVGNGFYQLGIPDAAFASGADNVVINIFGASNAFASPIRYSLYKYLDTNIVAVGNIDVTTTGVVNANIVSIDTTPANQVASGVWNVPTKTLSSTQAFNNTGNWIGNISGNVTGSVGTIAANGINDQSFDFQAITSNAFADGAIGTNAMELNSIGSGIISSGMVAAIADFVWRTVQSGYTTSGTFGNILDRKISQITASGGSGATAAEVWAYTSRSLTVTGAADIRLINGSGFNTVSAIDANVISITGTVVNQLSSGVWNMAQSGFGTSGTFGNILDRKISQITASGGSGATAAEVWSYATRQLTATQAFNNTGDWIGNISGNVTGSIGTVGSVGVTAIQNGLATSGHANQIYSISLNNSGVLANISGRLPITLMNGYIQSSVQEIKGNAITDAAFDATAVNEMTSGIFQYIMETGINFGQAVRGMAAVMAGLASGGGTSTVAFRAINNSGTTRISSTVDSSGNRTAITLNLGS